MTTAVSALNPSDIFDTEKMTKELSALLKDFNQTLKKTDKLVHLSLEIESSKQTLLGRITHGPQSHQTSKELVKAEEVFYDSRTNLNEIAEEKKISIEDIPLAEHISELKKVKEFIKDAETFRIDITCRLESSQSVYVRKTWTFTFENAK